jgi:hypothetical protein
MKTLTDLLIKVAFTWILIFLKFFFSDDSSYVQVYSYFSLSNIFWSWSVNFDQESMGYHCLFNLNPYGNYITISYFLIKL